MKSLLSPSFFQFQPLLHNFLTEIWPSPMWTEICPFTAAWGSLFPISTFLQLLFHKPTQHYLVRDFLSPHSDNKEKNLTKPYAPLSVCMVLSTKFILLASSSVSGLAPDTNWWLMTEPQWVKWLVLSNTTEVPVHDVALFCGDQYEPTATSHPDAYLTLFTILHLFPKLNFKFSREKPVSSYMFLWWWTQQDPDWDIWVLL